MQAAIDVRAISQRVRSGVITLRDVSLTVSRGELVAIIGASGSGKTTLLDAMCGLRPPTSGSVIRSSGNTGYVPQDDIIPLALPLTRTLRYAAALREVSDPSELLARPDLFFLDEPTSGLDPARGTELMRVLRRLTSAGTTVVLTTHNPLDADRCDKVAVLAVGGHLVFFGSPAAAREYFGADTLDEIYERLAGVSDPVKAWSRRFLRFSRTTAAVSPAPMPPPPLRPPVRMPAAPAAGLAAAAAPGSPVPAGNGTAGTGPARAVAPPIPAGLASGVLRPLRQWALLAMRNADVLTRARLTLAMLAGSPIAVLLMFLVLFRPGAFDPAQPSPTATVMILFWVAFGGFFFGLTYGLLQICAEFAVLRRDRFAGLSAGAYVLAKAAVLLPLLAVVDLLFLIVLRVLGRLPGGGDYPAMFVTLLLCSAAALGLGLLISAAVSEPSQATIAMPMVCFPQVLFVGAILPVPAMAVVGRWISYAMTNRWAFEALGNSLGVARLWATGRSPLGPPLLASYGSTFSRAVGADWLILTAFTVAFFAATIAVVIRKTR